MDPVTIGAFISPIIATVAAYLRDEFAKKAGEKVAETVGQKAGEAVASVGPQALTTIRSWFNKKNDSKALIALSNLEQDPGDEDYKLKLTKEATRIALDEPEFAQELKVLAERVSIAQAGSMMVSFENHAPNQGVQAGRIESLTFNPQHEHNNKSQE